MEHEHKKLDIELSDLRTKLNKMGDFQPEGVLESTNLTEVDPTDSSVIAELNSSSEPRFVTIKDGINLPVITAYRLLATN